MRRRTTGNCKTCPAREDTAIALNQRFEELVNKGATRSEVRNGMCLSGYANLGAADTEVRYFVEALLDRISNNEPLRTMPKRYGHRGIAGSGNRRTERLAVASPHGKRSVETRPLSPDLTPCGGAGAAA
jgi:hypothetical protein